MILLNGFLTIDAATTLEAQVRDGPYKSVVTHFQPEPTPLNDESLDQAARHIAEDALKSGIETYRRLIQPSRLAALAGPSFLRFLDGMSLGFAPVPALRDLNPVAQSGIRCDALLHIRLSAPDQYTGGDIQVTSSDRASQRFTLGQGDAVLFDWEDIFSIRVVHRGPLLHMLAFLQYRSRADSLTATAPLAEAAGSQNPDIAADARRLLGKIETL